MAKKRTAPPPQERKNRVMLSFNDQDHATLEAKAVEAGVATATYARLIVTGKMPPLSQ